jgi:hypothetical protein
MASGRKPYGFWTYKLAKLLVGEQIDLKGMNHDTYRGIVNRLRRQKGLVFEWRGGLVTRVA